MNNITIYESLTYSEAQTLVSNDELTPNALYYITDKSVVLKAINSNQYRLYDPLYNNEIRQDSNFQNANGNSILDFNWNQSNVYNNHMYNNIIGSCCQISANLMKGGVVFSYNTLKGGQAMFNSNQMWYY